MGFKKLLLITLFEVCFLPAGILQAQENSSSSREQNKAITVEEYVLFLNECATKDPYHLFEAKENSISRLGTVGEYQYSFLPEESQKPVTLLSTLDASRYGHWKSHQSNNTESLQEVTEESKEYLSGDEVTPISNNHSSCLKMDCLLKTNLCDFCLTRKEEPIFQSADKFPAKEYFGMVLFFLAPENVEEQKVDPLEHIRPEEATSPMNRTMGISGPNAPIPDSSSRAASLIETSHRAQHIEPLSSDHGIRTVAVQGPLSSKAKYRLNPEGKWEKQCPGEEEWTVINSFDQGIATTKLHPERESVLDIFCKHYTRHNEINKKIEQEKNRHTEQKQAIISLSEPEQSIRLFEKERKHQDILLMLQKAQRYQYYLNRATTKARHKETAIERTIILANHPNRLELLAEEAGRNYAQLALYQQHHREIENTLRTLDERPPQLLSAAEQGQQERARIALPHLNQAIENRILVRERSIALTQELPNHYQKDIKEVVSILKTGALPILEAKISAIRSYYSFLNIPPVHPQKKKYLDSAALSFSKAAAEAQKKNPNQLVIERYLRAAELYEEAAATWNANPEKATYLNYAGFNLFKAAEETQKENPNQLVIERCLRAAELHEEAAATWNANSEKATYLNKAGLRFFKAAEEAQKENPNQLVIERYLKAAESYEEAAATWDTNPKKAKCLKNAGSNFSQAAEEAQKENPNQLVIERYLRAAELFQQAVGLWDANPEKAPDLSYAGFNLFKAAEEAQKESPNQLVIERYLKAAELHEEAAATWNANSEKARDLGYAGFSLFKAAEEAQEENPDQRVIEGYLRAAELHEEAAATKSTHLEKATDLSCAGSNLFQAEEVEKQAANREVINRNFGNTILNELIAKIFGINLIQNAKVYIQSLLMGLKAIINRFLY